MSTSSHTALPEKLRGGVLAVCLFLLTGFPFSGAAAEHPGTGTSESTTTATEVVDNLHSALLDAMQSAELDFQGRYELLSPIIDETFDFPTIARVVTGSHWGKLNDHEKQVFVDTFARLSVATYASKFDDFSGERFKVISEKEHNGQFRIVKTELVKSDGETVELTYQLRSTEHGWQIVNVIANGVSDLSLKRADYSSVIDSEGFDSLVSKLNEQIVEYRKPASQE